MSFKSNNADQMRVECIKRFADVDFATRALERLKIGKDPQLFFIAVTNVTDFALNSHSEAVFQEAQKRRVG